MSKFDRFEKAFNCGWWLCMVLIVCGWLWFINFSTTAKYERMVVNEIEERIISPSSLKILDINITNSDILLGEEGYKLKNREDLTVLFWGEFEAKNGFGVVIRQDYVVILMPDFEGDRQAICTFDKIEDVKSKMVIGHIKNGIAELK